MITLCNTLLPSDKIHAIPADTGKTIKPIPVTDKIIEIDVAAIVTTLSFDYNSVFRGL